MLQRAASNAYTWWWASNVRTKQSKWLDNDLQEMEERVKTMIKLIDQDADSFAKKAEMYFKRRPELINSVEEAFRAYKSLADRYDRLSSELHKANSKLAAAFPDQVPMMEDEDNDNDGRSDHSVPSATERAQLPPPPDASKLVSLRSKRHLEAEPAPQEPKQRRLATQADRDKAREEIDMLQKRILVLQTEKEFFKSSYEGGLAKYWEIERQMNDLQSRITELQDEFNDGSVIEDDEARALMAASAIKSCEDTLVSLHGQQKRSDEEAAVESRRIRVAEAKLSALKGEELSGNELSESYNESEEGLEGLSNGRLELQIFSEKVKKHFEMSSESGIANLAEKIDGLVEKVIGLEVTVSSQTTQIKRLSSETEELHKYLRGVEEDKKNSSLDSTSLNYKFTQAEADLGRILALEKSVKDEKGAIRSRFNEACRSLNDLSERLQSPTPSEEASTPNEEDIPNKMQEESVVDGANVVDESSKDWQQSLLCGTEGRDKILMNEYVAILQNYKETAQRLENIEKKNEACHSETMQQIQELRCANAVKDEQIRTLRQKLFTSESLRIKSMKKSSANDDRDEGEVEDIVDPLVEQHAKLTNFEQLYTASLLEDKFRADIDTLLEENLDFWLRFSTSYHQIQKFQSTFKELQAEVDRVTEMNNLGEENETSSPDMKQTDKKMREFNTELQVWVENNEILQGELRGRFASITNIQDELAKLTDSSENEEVRMTAYQSAKFQGEVINMQQENNKVAKEIQTGLDHVKGLQVEVSKNLSRLHERYEMSGSKAHQHAYNQFRHLSTRSKIPLKTFLFGAKPKKQSLFACMNPVHHRHHCGSKHRSDSKPDGVSRPR